jgi:hypothetical protein
VPLWLTFFRRISVEQRLKFLPVLAQAPPLPPFPPVQKNFARGLDMVNNSCIISPMRLKAHYGSLKFESSGQENDPERRPPRTARR